jgi:superfamily II DNA or RNA helicase
VGLSQALGICARLVAAQDVDLVDLHQGDNLIGVEFLMHSPLLLPTQPPEVGQIVRVRSRRWLVEEVLQGAMPGATSVVKLACADDDAQGQELEVYWDYELDRQILSDEGWERLGAMGFDPPRQFAAFMHTLRWNCVTATDPGIFQAPFRSGIKIDAYQMEPLRKALRLPRVNLFIADDTGLGKTIEAGLIARELLLRKKVKQIVVSVPPSVIFQWKAELEERFGLVFEILDRQYLARIRRERGFGINPWKTHSRFLVSHQLLANETYAASMRDWLGELLPGSLLILDEAHHAAPASGGRYAIESKFTRAVRDLAKRFEHRLFLSATPHNGHSNSFSTLLEILDPTRFTRGVKVQKGQLDETMVRRLKSDIRGISGGFPKREVIREVIEGLPEDTPELQLSKLLDEYRGLREQRFQSATKRARAAAGLLVVGLQQRLLSSIPAFARSLRKHRDTVKRQWDKSQEELEQQLDEEAKRSEDSEKVFLEFETLTRPANADDDDRTELSPKEQDELEDGQMEAATQAAEAGASRNSETEELWARERVLLDRMQAIAEAAEFGPDEKIKKLVAWIQENLCQNAPGIHGEVPKGPAPWTNERVLIFTENREGTKNYLVEQLQHAIRGTNNWERRIEVIDGPTNADRRREIQRRFNANPSKDPLRILIGTEAAQEGLNFQAHCRHLFHFDLPWNPGRIEQRNGRIDRKLQPADTVYCHYFVLPQRVEDRVLEVLVEKTERIQKELGSLAKVIESQIESSLLKRGIRHSEADSLKLEISQAEIEAEKKRIVEEELEDTRKRQDKLREEIARCENALDRSRKWIQYEAKSFRNALDCSLEFLNAPPLEQDVDEDGAPIWRFPDLAGRAQSDSSWATTLDTLRSPRSPKQKVAEWRKEAPIRPVVFEDAGVLTDESVHLHLEQRVAQRLLARFRAQGFVLHDLSRACLAQARDEVPRVILLGRLALYGQGAERLHEEIIPVAAKWSPLATRNGAIQAYARGGEAERASLALLEDAFSDFAGASGFNSGLEQQLLAAAAKDIEGLRAQLEERARGFQEYAVQKLQERGRREERLLRETLEKQRDRVLKELAKHESQPLLSGWSTEEKRQFQANLTHWQKRVLHFESELKTEPQRIRAFYETKTARVEPIGLVYLMPKEVE